LPKDTAAGRKNQVPKNFRPDICAVLSAMSQSLIKNAYSILHKAFRATKKHAQNSFSVFVHVVVLLFLLGFMSGLIF